MIWNKLKFTLSILLFVVLKSCGIYSFTGASIPPGVTTFQVNFFENQAGNRPGSTVEPGLDNDFTNALQDIIMNQTNLNLVSKDEDCDLNYTPNKSINKEVNISMSNSFGFGGHNGVLVFSKE